MKKILICIVSLTLILFMLPLIDFADEGGFDTDCSEKKDTSLTKLAIDVFTVLADNEPDEDSKPEPEPERDVIPDDGFEGKYKDFSGKDGSVTRVYDNGSIVTTYPDGSREGMDYNGNRYTEDKDGKQVVYDIDGNQHIKNADGSEEAISKGGTHTYFNEDGSYRAVAPTGTIFEYDKNDEITAVSIEGGESMSLYDDQGNLITGEHVITSPDGKKFTFTNRDDEDSGEMEIKMWSEGNGEEFGFNEKRTLENDSENISVSYCKVGGIRIDASVNGSGGDESGALTGNVKFSDPQKGAVVDSTISGNWKDGSTAFKLYTTTAVGYSEELDMQFDKNGNINAVGTMNFEDGESITTSINGDEMAITNSRGVFLKSNLKTGAAEYYDPESGDHIKINDEGKVEIFQFTDDDKSTLTYENGEYIVKDKDGNVTTVIQTDEETGETTVTTETGDSYTITKDGKILKNGKEATPDDAEQTESPTQNTDQAEEGSVMPGSDLSIREIAGNYRCEGTQSDNMGDHWETEDSSMSFRFKINDNGQFVWAAGYGEYYEEMILLWDATLGAWTYQDNWDDVANEPSWFTEFGTFTFTKENGTIHLDVLIQQFDNEDGDLETKWVLSGTRED